MTFLRSIIFTVALAFGFILSGNLAGIEKIREGASDLTISIIDSAQDREFTAGVGVKSEPSVVSQYVTPTSARYLVIAIGLICGLFTATLIGAGVIGLVGGVLFSPEIASVPFLADAAVTISGTVSALWSDLLAKVAELQ